MKRCNEMKIDITRVRVKRNSKNEVTSDRVLRKRKPRDKDGKMLFDDDGIFSEKIFGRFGKCKCGKLTHAGICEECNTRVVKKNSLPTYYIPFDFLDIPYNDVKLPKEAMKLYKYQAFIHNGKIIDFNIDDENFDLSEYSGDILIGKDAILSLGYTEEQYNNNVHNEINIPHPYIRPITVNSDGKYVLGDINRCLVEILKKRKTLEMYYNDKLENKFQELAIKNYLMRYIFAFYDEIFKIIAKNRNNVVSEELRGQKLSGVVRGVITNNFDLDEDVVMLGSYFINTLYSELFAECESIEELNKRLIKDEYYVLFNRQPSIGQKSIMGMIPQFTDDPKARYVLQTNPIIYEGLASDCDGDNGNVIALYTKAACAEAKLRLPSRNYIEGSNGTIRNAIMEDFEYTRGNMDD